MDDQAFLMWFLFAGVQDSFDSNVQQEEGNVPVIDLTADEESTQPSTSSADRDERIERNTGEGTSTGTLDTASNAANESSSSDEDEDMGSSDRKEKTEGVTKKKGPAKESSPLSK